MLKTNYWDSNLCVCVGFSHYSSDLTQSRECSKVFHECIHTQDNIIYANTKCASVVCVFFVSGLMCLCSGSFHVIPA